VNEQNNELPLIDKKQWKDKTNEDKKWTKRPPHGRMD
jgi:hypothetical protein